MGRSSRRGPAFGLAQRITRLVRVERRTGGAGRRKPAGPWPVRPRLVVHDVSEGVSAPTGANRVFGSQGQEGAGKRKASRGTTRIQRSAWRMASTPSGGFPPSPAQAGRAASTSLGRGSVDPVVVLVDCSGCRSRREAPGPSRLPRRVTAAGSVGSSLPASCLAHVLGGERVFEAGSRRQSREHGGGLSMILRLGAAAQAKAKRWLGGGREPERRKRKRTSLLQGREHSSREGVLVSAKRSSLTRRRRRRCLAVSPGRLGRKAGSARRRPRQRASEATSQARLAVENAAVGRCSAEEHSIEAPPGPRGTTPTVALGATRARTTGTGCGKAEAGGSPSSEASPGGSPEAIGRGWAGVSRRAEGPARGETRGGERTWESGSPWGARVVGRLQKSVRRIFLVSGESARSGATRGETRVTQGAG